MKIICSYCEGKEIKDGTDIKYHHYYLKFINMDTNQIKERIVCKECYDKAMRHSNMILSLMQLFDIVLGKPQPKTLNEVLDKEEIRDCEYCEAYRKTNERAVKKITLCPMCGKVLE
jgi:hypothetical protein